MNLEKADKEISVDDLVIAGTPVYGQLFSAVADANLDEDLIYYFSKALNNDIIDLSSFLKV
jgi:hypothetical protein